MTAIAITHTDLRWDVLTVKPPGLTRDLPPGKEELMWVANSSTLIQGERDAVLVDTLLTTEQSKTLSDWVVASGKNLTAIYITRRRRVDDLDVEHPLYRCGRHLKPMLHGLDFSLRR
jgi:hypothetical protein